MTNTIQTGKERVLRHLTSYNIKQQRNEPQDCERQRQSQVRQFDIAQKPFDSGQQQNINTHNTSEIRNQC